MKKTFTLVLSILIGSNAFAQDDISKLLNEAPPPKQKVEATFKTTRIINLQSNETVHKRTLDVRIGHRFGSMGKNSGGNSHNLYGFDVSSDIRIAFEYGITDDLTVGFSRSKREENLEGLLKYRLIQQTTDNKIPLSITLFGSMIYTPKSDPNGIYSVDGEENAKAREQIRRISYVSQIILARKFSSAFSFELVPTYIHRNFVLNPEDDNGIFALGAAGRVKITRGLAFIADYVYNFSALRKPDNDFGYYNPLGAGIEIETGGHVFSIMFTNSAGIIESEFIPFTTETWSKGGFRFSFNISRNFSL